MSEGLFVPSVQERSTKGISSLLTYHILANTFMQKIKPAKALTQNPTFLL